MPPYLGARVKNKTGTRRIRDSGFYHEMTRGLAMPTKKKPIKSALKKNFSQKKKADPRGAVYI